MLCFFIVAHSSSLAKNEWWWQIIKTDWIRIDFKENRKKGKMRRKTNGRCCSYSYSLYPLLFYMTHHYYAQLSQPLNVFYWKTTTTGSLTESQSQREMNEADNNGTVVKTRIKNDFSLRSSSLSYFVLILLIIRILLNSFIPLAPHLHIICWLVVVAFGIVDICLRKENLW